jgi:hypothetical protein
MHGDDAQRLYRSGRQLEGCTYRLPAPQFRCVGLGEIDIVHEGVLDFFIHTILHYFLKNFKKVLL